MYNKGQALHLMNDPSRMVERGRVCVGCNLGEEFGVKVDIHQGFCLSPLLCIMVLEAPSQEFRTWCPWENLHLDDLIIITESLE